MTELPQLEVPIVLEPEEPRHPLIGIVAALRHAGGRPVLVVACDLPLVSPALLAELAASPQPPDSPPSPERSGTEPLVLAAPGGDPQPLLGRYPAVLPGARIRPRQRGAAAAHRRRALARASSKMPSSPASATPPSCCSTSTTARTCAGRRYPRRTMSSGFVSRGFVGRPHAGRRRDRLPPGQYVERGFPVLTAGPTPRLDTGEWSFRIDGMVGKRARVELGRVPPAARSKRSPATSTASPSGRSSAPASAASRSTRCSTAPSRATPTSMAYSYGGYTTNLPLEDLTGGKAWVVTEHEGEPLPREHGGPARLLVPHLYFWKSAKWVHGLRVMDHDEPGFWETQRLPQPRRPLEGAALLDGLSAVARRAAGAGPLADRRPSSAIQLETPRVKSFRIALPMWMPHLPGQHYDVRLTAPDGYRAAALLLDRLLAARRGRDRADDRPARRTARSRPTSTTWSSRATRSRSAAPSPPTSSGAGRSRCSWSAAAPASCR